MSNTIPLTASTPVSVYALSMAQSMIGSAVEGFGRKVNFIRVKCG